MFGFVSLFSYSPDAQVDFGWEVVNDLYGSDHYPLILSLAQAGASPPMPPQWRLKEA